MYDENDEYDSEAEEEGGSPGRRRSFKKSNRNSGGAAGTTPTNGPLPKNFKLTDLVKTTRGSEKYAVPVHEAIEERTLT